MIKPITEFGKTPRVRSGRKAVCLVCTNKESRQYRKDNPSFERSQTLKKAWGLSLEAFESWSEQQNNVCAICQNPNGWRKHLVVDHNHETGNLRGLLCDRCNRAIGFFEDNPALLRKAALYLEKHKDASL